MGKFTRKRKIFITLAIGLSLFVVLSVTLPLWFPWILKPVLKNFNVRYASYERDGFSRFILRDVDFANGNLSFQAQTIRAGGNRQIEISNWSLNVLDSERTNKTDSIYSTVEKADQALGQVARWISKVNFKNGTVRLNQIDISVPSLRFNESGSFSATLFSETNLPITDITGQIGPKTPKQIIIETPAWDLKTQLTIQRNEQDVQLEGELFWQSNRVEIAARVGRDGSLPESASIVANSFRIPAPQLKLDGYRDLTGSLSGRWQSNHFEIDLRAEAEPARDDNLLPPINAVVYATGDTNSIRLETVDVSAPWLQLQLSRNVEFNFRGEMLSREATLNVAADLSKQRWITAKGKLNGNAVLQRGNARFPDAKFNLAGTTIDVGGIEAAKFEMRGDVQWPWLQIGSAKVEFENNATAELDFRFDADTKQIADGNLRLNGVLGRKFLPEDISYDDIALTAQFSGPLKKILHSGRVDLRGIDLPQMASLDVVANWEGSQLDFNNYQATVSAEETSLSLAGSLNVRTNSLSARILRFDLEKNEKIILKLENPFVVSVGKKSGQNSRWDFETEPARWREDKSELSISGKVHWPETGNFSMSAQDIHLGSVADFFKVSLPAASAEKMEFSADWTNGPVNFLASALGHFSSADGTRFTVDLKSAGNANGISIGRANAGTQSETVISGKGILPIRFEPAHPGNIVQILPTQPIDFKATTLPNVQFWERIAQWTRADFREPNLSIVVAGTMDSPAGRVRISAQEIVLKPLAKEGPIGKLPTNAVALQTLRLRDLQADFDLAPDRVLLKQFEIYVEGQPVRMTGELPLPKNLVTDWKNLFDWRRASAHLQIVDAQIAPFARLFPELLSPLGTLNLDVRADRAQLHGELRLADAALRPISTLGSIHDISARLKFLGNELKLESFRGSIGGQPVELSGEINLEKKDLGLPAFDFRLKGTNVPLARRADLILRSDLNLKIANETGGVPLVSGALKLRDSFFLSNLKILVPGKVATPSQRPPFFSVETEPFAAWRLNIAVSGNEFLRVRSPLFRGEVSANLKVEGTLKEPVALGDAKINSGVIQFPFANLRVEQGFVSLTSENPYQPRLSISASSRTFGYDVKIDISGFAENPIVEFSSNPGLTSEQILLMVTAGELPRDEINFSSQEKAGRVAFFLGKSLISKFGGTGATEEKLEIRSGEEVSEQGQQTYYLEYKLTEDWSVVGEYDRFGGVNAGFKWKFYQK